MSPPRSHSLDVPGARLYYEVQGSGPTLMLVGHPMGASGFAPIVPLLAESYKIVTYDPRGFGRSTIDDPDQDAEPDLLADDVRRVLEAVGEVPANVFGSSGGAVYGSRNGCPPPEPCSYPHRPRAPTRGTPATSRGGARRNPRGVRLLPRQRYRRRLEEVRHRYRHDDPPPWRGCRSAATVGRGGGDKRAFLRSRPPSHRSLPAGLLRPTSRTGAGRSRRWNLLQGRVRPADGCCARRTPRHSVDRLPRRPCRFRHRFEGFCRRPPPHIGLAHPSGHF